MEGKKPDGFFDGNPKMIFIFGLVTGVALTSILGGGIKLPSFAAGNNGSDVVRTFDNDDGGSAPDPSGQQPSGTLAPVTGDEHILGDLENAKVVLVEYSDFECPFCSRHHPTMKQIVDEFGDDVAWVYRHFPLSIHPEAKPSAAASECAAEQGEFWAYGDALIDNQDKLSDDLYAEIADDLGLNTSEFQDCYDSGKYADAVTEDYNSGLAAGVTGTPATFVNGQLVSGAVPFETLSSIIEAEIQAAE